MQEKLIRGTLNFKLHKEGEFTNIQTRLTWLEKSPVESIGTHVQLSFHSALTQRTEFRVTLYYIKQCVNIV